MDFDQIENNQYLRELENLEQQEHESEPGIERYMLRVEIYRRLAC